MILKFKETETDHLLYTPVYVASLVLQLEH